MFAGNWELLYLSIPDTSWYCHFLSYIALHSQDVAVAMFDRQPVQVLDSPGFEEDKALIRHVFRTHEARAPESTWSMSNQILIRSCLWMLCPERRKTAQDFKSCETCYWVAWFHNIHVVCICWASWYCQLIIVEHVELRFRDITWWSWFESLPFLALAGTARSTGGGEPAVGQLLFYNVFCSRSDGPCSFAFQEHSGNVLLESFKQGWTYHCIPGASRGQTCHCVSGVFWKLKCSASVFWKRRWYENGDEYATATQLWLYLKLGPGWSRSWRYQQMDRCRRPQKRVWTCLNVNAESPQESDSKSTEASTDQNIARQRTRQRDNKARQQEDKTEQWDNKTRRPEAQKPSCEVSV